VTKRIPEIMPTFKDLGWQVRLGVSPLSWTNDDLEELGGDIPLETSLKAGGA
jgi:inosose dehydratase